MPITRRYLILSEEAEDRTLSPEPCEPVDTQREVESALGPSRRRKKSHLGKKAKWEKLKVFARPEYRTPFLFKPLMPGRRIDGDVPGWIRVAIESGLVEMGSPNADLRLDELLEPLGDHPPPRMSREALELMWAKGIAEVLAYRPEEKKNER